MENNIMQNYQNMQSNQQNQQLILCPNCRNYEYANIPQCRRCGYVFNNQFQQQYYPNFQRQGVFKNVAINNNSASVEVMDPNISGLIGTILVLIGLIGSAIAVFMPFITANTFGISQSEPLFGNSIDSYFILLICIFNAIFVICKFKTYIINTFLSGGFLLFLGIFHYINTSSNIEEIDEYYVIAKVGSGNYMLIIGSALVIVGSIVFCATKYNKKHFFNT